MADPDDGLAVELLRLPPSLPVDISRFSADGFAGPGCYPDGPPMEPAVSPGVPSAALAEHLVRLGAAAERWWADPSLAAVVPDDHLRMAAAALAATVGAPLLDGLVARQGVAEVRWGDPGGSRIAGRLAGDDAVVVVSSRYRAEHPLLCTGSLLHQLCSPPQHPSTHPREVLLHALLAVAQTQLVELVVELAEQRTELARRQHTLVLSLLESRPSGRARVRIVAPDGGGTIPGGAPGMQTPDFWSIPFPGGDEPSPTGPALQQVLGPWVPAVHAELLAGFGRPLVDVVDSHVLDAVLRPGTRARAMAALGLVACGDDDPGRRLAPVPMRRAHEADAERLAEIHLAARPVPSVHDRADVVRHHRDDVIGGLETWVATTASGQVTGYLALGAADGPGAPAEVVHLYVDPEHAGRGIGGRLLALAQRRRPEGLELWVFQRNGAARRFYETRGFRAAELTDGSGNEEREPDVRLRWPA